MTWRSVAQRRHVERRRVGLRQPRERNLSGESRARRRCRSAAPWKRRRRSCRPPNRYEYRGVVEAMIPSVASRASVSCQPPHQNLGRHSGECPESLLIMSPISRDPPPLQVTARQPVGAGREGKLPILTSYRLESGPIDGVSESGGTSPPTLVVLVIERADNPR